MSEEPGRALLTGLTGQDGSFLAELLLEQGYEVTALVRRAPGEDLGLAEHLRGRVELVAGDLLVPETLTAAVRKVGPAEIYHLGAPTFLPDSWRRPAATLQAIAGSTAALLEAVTTHAPTARLFVASSGEIFGDAPESPQRETTACRPRSPYATAKLAAHHGSERVRAHRRAPGPRAGAGLAGRRSEPSPPGARLVADAQLRAADRPDGRRRPARPGKPAVNRLRPKGQVSNPVWTSPVTGWVKILR